VLGVLLDRPGEIVSREQPRTRIWEDTIFVEFDQNLNYCIRQIRVALGTRPRGRSISKLCQTGLSVHWQ
jgi:DNA-binding winged helix-turn-helix (wHTH) protein